MGHEAAPLLFPPLKAFQSQEEAEPEAYVLGWWAQKRGLPLCFTDHTPKAISPFPTLD
jgi:hypothetical protein